MFIELHLIQNFAPSNLNRDDTGNPKDTDFGGVRRARISSQAIKRAMREEAIFAESTQVPSGERSKWMTRPIVKRLIEAGKSDEEAQLVANATVAAYHSKKEKMDGDKPNKTLVLVYFSTSEIANIVEMLLENWDEAISAAQKGKAVNKLINAVVKETQERATAPDIALFGRMLADKPELNIDAASQVAHAISTHRVNMDMDFFTAVDDLQEEDETGSSHMSVTAFNSACFYRYARIDFKQLVKNLDGNEDLARKTVVGYLRAALRAIPSGKQNSFAAQNPPSFALAVARKDGMSWSLANAFEKPVTPAREGGFVKNSIEAADEYWGKLSKVYGNDGMSTFALKLDDDAILSALAGSEKDSESEWIEGILAALETQEA